MAERSRSECQKCKEQRTDVEMLVAWLEQDGVGWYQPFFVCRRCIAEAKASGGSLVIEMDDREFACRAQGEASNG